MSHVDSILAEVRSLANRGEHQTIVARYGTLDDTPEEETWNSTELLYEIGHLGVIRHWCWLAVIHGHAIVGEPFARCDHLYL